MLLKEMASVYNTAAKKLDLIEIWDQQIAEVGAKVIQTRNTDIERSRAKLASREIAFTPEPLDVKYRVCNELSPNVELQEIQSQLSVRLEQACAREMGAKCSLVGPHCDELYSK